MIGQLFRRRDDTKLKRNLLVKLTPGILDYTE
jgi:type II secretory pathway component GspD/PulD (secretin)